MTDKKLYEQVADHIQNLVLEKTLIPGERLPSVRKLKQQLSVSTSTILEAYRLLENRGVITARPRSGYYVNPSALDLLKKLPQSMPAVKESLSSKSQLFQIRYDPSLINLGAAVPGAQLLPLKTLNRLMGKVMRENPITVHSYDTFPGCEPLRREVAKRMLNAECVILPNKIITTSGTTEAYYLALCAVTQPGDTVAIQSPTCFSIIEALKHLGLEAFELPTDPRGGISLKVLQSALDKQQISACLLVSNFSNPLGCCMTSDKKQILIDLLNHYDIPLIEDDVYGELYFGKHRPKPLKAFDTEERVIYCTSVSKTLSPGLRVGWCIPGRYQKQIEQMKVVASSMTATAPQLAVAAFFANGGYDRHLRNLRRAYQQHMRHIHQAILEYFPAETKINHPKGGQVLWVEIMDDFDATKLFKEALQYNISIAPGPLFSSSNKFQTCFRLNMGLPWSEEIDNAMRTLGNLSKKQLAYRRLSTNLLQ